MIKMSLFISILLSQLFAFAGNGDGGAGIVKPAAFSAMSANVSLFQAADLAIFAGGEGVGPGIVGVERFVEDSEVFFLVKFLTDKGIEEAVFHESELETEAPEVLDFIKQQSSVGSKVVEI